MTNETSPIPRHFCAGSPFSTRPMTLKEIAETVVVDFEAASCPMYDSKRRYRNERDVLEKCSGLLTESEGMN